MDETRERLYFEAGDALVLVDLQVDFCPGGALPIEAGDEVIPVANSLIRKAAMARIPIYASRDWHPQGHPSFAQEGGKWPVHCIQDSAGAHFHRNLELPDTAIVVTKGVRFDQDQNSAFDQTGLEVHMRRKGVRRLFVCGLALDVCVLATVLDARRLGFAVNLILSGTRPVTKEGGRNSVEAMKKAGAAVFGDTAAFMGGRPDAGTDRSGQLPVCEKAPEWAEHQRLADSDEPCDDGRSGNI